MIVSSKKSTIVAQVQEQAIGAGADVPTKRMGRKKIQISRIADERNRQVTFTKRKFGLMKKAYELSVLCDCEIALIIFNSANKLFQYASTDMDKVLLKYTEYNEPHESRTNKDIIDSLNKKEHKGCESPDPECDPYMNTISFEEKYNRMNEDYQRVLQQQNQMRAPMSPYPPGGLSPGAMPMHNSPYMNHSLQGHMGQHSPAISSPGLLQPPPGPGSLSPRPNSTGHMVEMSQSPTPNGYHRVSPCSSPGMIPGGKSPPLHNRAPPPGHPGPPRLMVPDARNNMMNSEMQQHSPGVPAVSISTPSISQGTGYHSPLPSYHNNEYLGGSGDGMVGGGGGMGQGYSPQPSPHHWSQGSLTSGIPPGGNMHHLQGSGQNIGSASGNHVSPLLINTMNQRLNIKSEPLSPTRDSNTPNMGLRPPSQNPGQYSPGHMSPHLNASHSNCSSPTPGLQQHGGHPPHQQNPVQPPGGPPVTMTTHDQHQQHGGMNGGCGLPDYDSGGPMMKRARLEGWTT
ncbi:myocyte-specific enhancer factor 2C-like isoform X2 [Mya arenaria]|uniref:myocyte-specific enhancer factor 2C-like isoform X2 n=1 Tax=Mya arenaria TaxID=6604 RepID=UPI0022E3681F|nr:myocyte-specific enhancer factor 2C-like isoform X2 [Mya arenaria]XP_052793394.1 myocyte-specific enhancer factor 2C-like isoform X2 [Mya arenaria]